MPKNKISASTEAPETKKSMTFPGLFGAVIVQSPSPDNRAKLSEIPKEMLKERNIILHISCGQFEHPDYAAANDNIGYATDLSRQLGVPPISSKSIFSHPENKASTMKPDKQDEKIQVGRKKGG